MSIAKPPSAPADADLATPALSPSSGADLPGSTATVVPIVCWVATQWYVSCLGGDRPRAKRPRLGLRLAGKGRPLTPRRP